MDSTPMKSIENTMEKENDTNQCTSVQMKLTYLENKLKMKMKRLDFVEERNKELNDKVAKLETAIREKDTLLIELERSFIIKNRQI